jgi:hypothetical protein
MVVRSTTVHRLRRSAWETAGVTRGIRVGIAGETLRHSKPGHSVLSSLDGRSPVKLKLMTKPITEYDAAILAHLAEQPSAVSYADVARAIGISPSKLPGITARLVRDGKIVKKRGPGISLIRLRREGDFWLELAERGAIG